MSATRSDRKGSGGGITLIVLMIAGFVVAGGNLAWLNVKGRQDLDAVDLVSQIQVLSPELVNLSLESVGGNIDGFKALEKARDTIDATVQQLNGLSTYKNEPSIAPLIAKINSTWEPLKGRIRKIIENKEIVLNAVSVAGPIKSADKGMPFLAAQMEAVTKALIAEKSGSVVQVYTTSTQVVLSNRILRRVQLILQGGVGAEAQVEAEGAADGLLRDERIYKEGLSGLLMGNSDISLRALDNEDLRKIVKSVDQQWRELNEPIKKLVEAAPALLAMRDSTDQISLDAKSLLLDGAEIAKTLKTLPEYRTFPNIWISWIAGPLGLVAFLWFLFRLFRDQQRRYQNTTDLNKRNEQAILRLLDEMVPLAEGDLTVSATVTEDITGSIADSVNFAVDALRSLVKTINETAVQVSAAAQETQATAMHLAEAAEHQAQQITSASAAINEIAVSIDDVSKNSAESADVAQRSVQIAAKGASMVRQTIQGMDNIRDQIQETSKRIKRLGESSQEIGSIVELINDIAEQTNILALNAAIQAASAGEAGRGFAVVADEVQRLAERASGATKRIETLVQTIQSDTHEAVSSMEQTTTEVVAGARLAEDAGLALGEIEKVSNDLSDLIQNISEAARQQSAAATNISSTMNLIQEITSQTSVGASQTAESIGNLAQMAADLRRSVTDFKLPS